MKSFYLNFAVSKVVLDFIALLLAWIIGYFIRINYLNFEVSGFFPEISFLFSFFIYSSFAYIFLAFTNNLYKIEPENNFKIINFLKILNSIFLWGLLIIAFYAIWKHQLFFSRIYLATVLFLALFFILFFRFCLKLLENYLFSKGIGVLNILIVGKNDLISKFCEKISKIKKFKIDKIVDKFVDKMDIKNIDEIWLLDGKQDKKEIINFCQIKHIGFRFKDDTDGILFGNFNNSIIGGMSLFSIISTKIFGWGAISKRFFDIILSTIFLICLLPLFLTIAILIKLESKGPIFYISKRVGKAGKLFKIIKFRSMIINAEDLKQKLLKENQRKGPLFKIKNDPRITKLGNFLRRFSIDELPQFFNVLKGDMSIIGPRPHLEKEILNYKEMQKRVLSIKPGITGISQVSGRSDLSFENEIALDLKYIENWSFTLDLQIFFKTPVILLQGNGAD